MTTYRRDHLTTREDLRAAAQARASLSPQAITGALALMAALTAIATFVLEAGRQAWWFSALAAAGTASLGASIFLGTRCIGEISRQGFAGRWSLSTGLRNYPRQASLAVAGFALVVATGLVGGSTSPRQRPDDRLDDLERMLERLQDDRVRLAATIGRLELRLALTADELRETQSELARLDVRLELAR
jgi:hypothetical protein